MTFDVDSNTCTLCCRLYVHFGLGEGMPIAYRCIAGGDLGVGFPEIMGTKVRFTVIEDGKYSIGNNNIGL